MVRIAVTTSSFGVDDDAPLRKLSSAGADVVRNATGRTLGSAEVLELCSGCSGIVAGTEIYDRATLERLTELRAIARVGVGLDSIDLAAAEALGIAVSNTPDGPTRAVAELTVALIMDMLRRVSLMDRELRAGTWRKRSGNLLLGKKVGIVGLGRIGSEVARLLGALGADPAYSDVCESPGSPCDRRELDDLLAWADIVTLHCGSQAGGTLIGEGELAQMRPNAWLVNAARGSLVDEAALVRALEEGRLAGAALDVFGTEPYDGPLARLDNVVLTPHIGSYASESRITMEVDAVGHLLNALGLGEGRTEG